MVKGTITFQEFIEDITQHLTLKQYQGKTLQELFLLLDINLQNLFPSSETIAPKKHIQNEKDSTYLKKKYSL